jgi:hypothetical protein
VLLLLLLLFSVVLLPALQQEGRQGAEPAAEAVSTMTM